MGKWGQTGHLVYHGFLMVVPIRRDKNHIYVELKETWPK